MKAAVYKGIENMVVEEVANPQLPEDGVIVQVKSCGICGSDLRTYYSGTSYIHPPTIIGHEIAGTIVEIGPKADIPFEIGDRVAIAPPIHCGECYYCQRGKRNLCLNLKAVSSELPGGFAEYIALPGYAIAKGCFARIPDSLSFSEAAISELTCSVIKCQEHYNINVNDVVVVLGAGPIGSLHVQLAKLRGAQKVILSDILESRVEMARTTGADIIVNSAKSNLKDIVMEATNGLGASVAIVAAPSAQAALEAQYLVAKGGKLILFAGFPKADSIVALDGNLIHYGEIEVLGTAGFTNRHHQLALELASKGSLNLKELISYELPLEKIVEGIEAMKNGSALKVVVTP